MTARRLTLALMALLLAAVGLSSTVWTAYAGGPTSVLLVNPDAGRAAALYHSSSDYQRLVDAISAYGSDLGTTDRPDSVSERARDAYRLTWLVHDVTIWRIDRVYATADDGLWLQTVVDETGGDPFARPGRWHRVVNTEALTAVLTNAGVTEWVVSTAATTAPPGTGVGPIATAAGIAGAVLGAAGALLFVRARSAERNRVRLSG